MSGWASAPHSWFGTRKVWVCVLGVFCLVAASVSPVAEQRSGRLRDLGCAAGGNPPWAQTTADF